MFRRSLYLAILCLLAITTFSHTPLHAQDDWNIEHLSSKIVGWQNPYGVCIGDGYAYVATGLSGLYAVNIQDPEVLVEAGAALTGGSIQEATIYGNSVYTLDLPNGLGIFDVSDPANPVVAGGLERPGISHAPQVHEDRLYIMLEEGIEVLSLENPHAPVSLGILDSTAELRSYVFQGDYLFGVERYLVRILDIQDPTAAVQITSFPLDYCMSIAVEDTIMAISKYNPFEFHLYSIANPASPDSLGSGDTWECYSIILDGDYAYCEGEGGVLRMDISNPSTPVFEDYIEMVFPPSDLKLDGSFLYATSREQGISATSVDVFGQPYYARWFKPYHGYWDMLATEDLLLGTYRDSLSIHDISNPQEPETIGHLPIYRSFVEVIHGELAYGVHRQIEPDPMNLFTVFDVQDPTNPAVLSTLEGYNLNSHFVLNDGIIYAITVDDVLLAIDVQDSANPTVAGSAQLSFSAIDMALKGSLLYLHDNEHTRLRMYNVENPSEMVPADPTHIFLHYESAGMHKEGNRLYFFNTRSPEDDIQIFDISDAPNPTLVGGYFYPAWIHTFDVEGHYLYLGISGGMNYDVDSLKVVDVWDAAAPVLVGAASVPRSPIISSGFRSMTVNNGLAWICTQYTFDVFDCNAALSINPIEQPLLPDGITLSPAYPNPFNAYSRLTLTLPREGQVKISVTDILGRQVLSLREGRMTAGSHDVLLDATTLGSGTYFIQARVEGKTIPARRVVLLK